MKHTIKLPHMHTKTRAEVAEIKKHIETLRDFQAHIIEQGHTFWHCSMYDATAGLSFAYFQQNRTAAMSTCGNCQKLMDLKRQIRALQKAAGLPVDPIRTRIAGNVGVHVSVNNASEYNPNLSFLRH